jgi:very-short-patch-repair endonuclease/DNA-directed RNA polymerase subunit RPC12/RpoP
MDYKNKKSRIRFKKLFTKEFLIQEYLVKKKSTLIIAKENNTTKTTILKYLKRFSIKRRIPKRENHYRYTDGWSYKKHYCIDCGKEIKRHNTIRCKSCVAKERFKNPLNNPGYIDGRTNKKYHCINCNKEICYKTIREGNSRCKQCAQKILQPILQNTSKMKKKHRKIMLELYKNQEWKNNILKKSFLGRLLRPNKPEKLLQKILPKSFKYVGNGYTWIAGKNPDFINYKEKKIIELFGDYWHKRTEMKQRIKHFKKYGYKTIIIWEHELKNINKVKNKIISFIKSEE